MKNIKLEHNWDKVVLEVFSCKVYVNVPLQSNYILIRSSKRNKIK